MPLSEPAHVEGGVPIAEIGAKRPPIRWPGAGPDGPVHAPPSDPDYVDFKPEWRPGLISGPPSSEIRGLVEKEVALEAAFET